MKRLFSKTTCAVALFVLAALTPGGAAAHPIAPNSTVCDCWQNTTSPNAFWNYPIDHVDPAAAFDEARGQLIKFGGKAFITAPLDSTYAWNGTNWTLLSPSTTAPYAIPPARYASAMAYDPNRKVIVMFGGAADIFSISYGVPASDTWEWDGIGWYKPPAANTPYFGGTAALADVPFSDYIADPAATKAGLLGHTMTWDPVREEILLFGGVANNNLTSKAFVTNETWAYKDGLWSKRTPATVPPSRAQHAVAADPARGKLVMFAGTTLTAEPAYGPPDQTRSYTQDDVDTWLKDDTWIWDGTNWSQVFPANKPDPRRWHRASSGYQAKPPVLFGGSDFLLVDINGDTMIDAITTPMSDLWIWKGDNWEQITVPEGVPASRAGSAARCMFVMAYDTVHEEDVIAGGFSLATGELTATNVWVPPFGRTLKAQQYFAEGFTGWGNFDEYYTILNTDSDNDAYVRMRYLKTDGSIVDRDYTVPKNARATISANADLGSGVEHSTIVFASRDVRSERAMYFNFGGRAGGHVDPGLENLSKEFYFAEGYTGPGFDAFLTLMNPNSWPVTVDVKYLFNSGGSTTKTHVVSGSARKTIDVRGDIGDKEFSTKVTARDGYIAAERPMYFNFMGYIDGGSVSSGQTALSPTAELAEGYTGPGFQEYLTIGNPGATPGTLTLRFFKDVGGETVIASTIAANERKTFNVNSLLPPGTSHGTRVESSVPVMVERPMYFDYSSAGLGVRGGDVGVGFAASTWAVFPESYVNWNFHTYYTLANPNTTPATATINYHFTDGSVLPQTVVVPAKGRLTVKVNDVFTVTDKEFSVAISADKPILVERPEYFNYRGWTGGHISKGFNGAPAPA